MDRKIRVGAVSYLNTKPLIYGLEQGLLADRTELITDYPSRIANMLLEDKIDIGLVPVAIIPQMQQSYIETDYCIGCEGPVASVCLFSEVPIEKVTHVMLDYQSRTSVRLAQILLKEYWKISPEIIDAKEDFRKHIKGTIAAVIIGDRAFEQRTISPYIYDLGETWIKHTSLPFVFATWVSNRKLDKQFIEAFNEANAVGLSHIDKVITENPYDLYDLKKYYTENIDYRLTGEKLKGLELFIEKLEIHSFV